VAALKRNLVRHLEGHIRAKFECYHWEGWMDVEFEYQLSIYSRTKVPNPSGGQGYITTNNQSVSMYLFIYFILFLISTTRHVSAHL
jgi:hypothetical protein